MPKSAIRYRWNFIAHIAKCLLNKINKIHESGYCCPYLTYESVNANTNYILDKILLPCRIDSQGKIVEIAHNELFSMDDPYCMPEVFRNKKKILTFKCDSWKFGCILYEFIWGHPPKNYFN